MSKKKVGETVIYQEEIPNQVVEVLDKEMKIRMYEYDNQITLLHRKRIWEQGEDEELAFPYSVIIYLTHTSNTPDEERLRVKLPNGETWEYVIPVLKVQEYTLEQFQGKKLYFLIPLLSLRYYSIKKKVFGKTCQFR